MNIDEMKNRISLALKDPILQQGFEIICKENAELKEQVNEWLNAYSDTSLVKVLRDCIYKNEKLSSQEQQQLSAWVECAMDFGSNLDECTGQLTKAKEIIREFVEWANWQGNSKCPSFKSIQEKAEQFISEVEK